ncbi:class II aldolase/adducin family protein [Brucella intermedia]|uniref:class II aldolase/adducin family protein n=1 Tax=Brucella intermedia TaxID=94625 RepID=UPI00235ECB8E|nr:class II aldolase/adducin family protein [Brucella intermedia]
MCSPDNPHQPIAVAITDTAEAAPPPSPHLIEDLVAANHILFDQGVVDGFGHVSVRHDKRPDRFLLARNMAPGRVSREDIVEFTLDGDAVDAAGRKVYLERYIHGEIYRRRPDVKAVVHSHSHAIVPFSIAKNFRMKAVFHMAGFVGQNVPVYEIREAGGDATDLLVSNNHLGRALAEKFDASDIVLMRGHGSTVVADSMQRAVYRAIYAELNARYLMDASKLGEVVYLTEGECRAAAENIEAQVHRPWDLWVEQARARRAAF